MSASHVRKWAVRTAIVVALFYTPIASVNPASRLALIDSLLSRDTPATEASLFFNRLDMVFEDGHFYSDKPPLLALYSTAILAPVYGPLTFDGGARGKILYWLVVASASGLALVVLVLVARTLQRRTGGRLTWKWVAFGIVGATCVFPFARTYNDHIVEAAALLAVLVLLRGGGEGSSRWRMLAVGALVGLTWLLHPLVGSVAAVTTGLYYLLRGAGKGLGRPVVSTAVFTAGALGVVGLGTGVHEVLYDRALPFYFSPELYLWTDGPGGVESHWMVEPIVPGLTERRIEARFAELGVPRERLVETLALFEAHAESVRNPASFALGRLFRYGQLTLNPLVLFCLVLSVASLTRSPRTYRAETLWVLATVAGLLAASIALRSVPGGSFGDRHLLPAVPLLVATGGLAAVSARDGQLFRALALLSVTIMLPGAMAPWVTPGDAFLVVNLALGLAAVLGAVLVRSANEGAPATRTWNRLQSWFTYGRVVALVGLLAAAEVLLYLGTLPAS